MPIGTFAAIMLSIAMIAAFTLLIAGVKLALKPAERRRGLLMIVAGLVLVGNVMIWAWPAG